MNAARASWWSVVVICVIAAILLALNGYAGYCIVLGAIGLAALVNLL